jgi:cell division protein FtsB
MKSAMTKVKGSPVYRLKIVPHRPFRSAFISLLLLIVVLAAVAASYFYATKKASVERLSPQEGKELRSQLEALGDETTQLRREVAKYQLGAEVDRKAGEELRKRVMELREEKAALQREVDVYRIMTSKKNSNPKGISFGVFSIAAAPDGKHQFKLVIQKLAEGDDDFVGELTAIVVGQQEGKEVKLSLHTLAVNKDEPMTEKIPLNFKFFQNIETEILIPEGFTPKRLELAVKSTSRSNPLTIDAQLEWPEHK